MPVVVDIKREIFAKFAKQNVPRNYVIDRTGKIIYEHEGYSTEAFEKMRGLIELQLGLQTPAAIKAQGPVKNPLQIAAKKITNQNFDEAVSDLKAILEKAPDNAQAHYLLGICYASKKEYDIACSEYQRAAQSTKDPKLKDLCITALKKLHR